VFTASPHQSALITSRCHAPPSPVTRSTNSPGTAARRQTIAQRSAYFSTEPRVASKSGAARKRARSESVNYRSGIDAWFAWIFRTYSSVSLYRHRSTRGATFSMSGQLPWLSFAAAAVFWARMIVPSPAL
jgi:hypothetical protein